MLESAARETPMTENESHDISNADKNDRLNQKRFVVEKATLVVLAIYTLIAGYQAFKMRTATKAATESADAAKSAAETAAASMVVGERPWIATKHRIVSPLTFNVGGRASGIPIAMMTLEDTLENIGQTVAVNVRSWEDVIPMDRNHTINTARERQKQWCDANRYPDTRGLSGYTLFPHDASVGQSIVGPQMPKVTEAEITNEVGLNGKVAFVVVGCVSYRPTFE